MLARKVPQTCSGREGEVLDYPLALSTAARKCRDAIAKSVVIPRQQSNFLQRAPANYPSRPTDEQRGQVETAFQPELVLSTRKARVARSHQTLILEPTAAKISASCFQGRIILVPSCRWTPTSHNAQRKPVVAQLRRYIDVEVPTKPYRK